VTAPDLFWLMSQFWQNTQRRLHMEKKTVPLPFQPCAVGNSNARRRGSRSDSVKLQQQEKYADHRRRHRVSMCFAECHSLRAMQVSTL
jgi:hypothetical protein